MSEETRTKKFPPGTKPRPFSTAADPIPGVKKRRKKDGTYGYPGPQIIDSGRAPRPLPESPPAEEPPVESAEDGSPEDDGGRD